MDFFRHFSPLSGAKWKALYFNAAAVSKTLESATTLFIRTMRLTGVILLAFCLQVSARSDAQQRIAINVKNIPLQKLFAEIEKKTSYTFFYDVSILKDTKPVTMVFKEATVEEILKQALAGQSLEYTITDKTIFVKKEKKVAVEAAPADMGGGDPDAMVKAKGVVLNEASQPIVGANVTVKQTQKGTITNAKGEFELSSVVPGNILVFSYVGYAPQNITVKDGTAIRIYMKVAQNELDKAVVQAYGTTTQRLTTSDIATVGAEEIEKQAFQNPLLDLQGKIAGLDVVQTSGFASAPIKVELRGRSAVGNFPSDPLYIIDGVPLTVLDIGGNSSYKDGSTGFLQTGGGFNGPAGGQSPFFSLNPADIESIEVLKDADATAIYGSRGANGVILITTKKGKAGKTKLDIHVQEGVDRVSRFWSMLSTPQYLAMRREAFYNDAYRGISPNTGNAYDMLSWDTTRSTDWQRAIYGGMGNTVDVQVGLTGGDARTTFRIAAGYNRTAEITTVSGSDQRATASFNLSHASMDQRLTVSFSSAFSHTQSDMINLPGSVVYAPDAPSIYDSAGNLNYAAWDVNGNYPFAGLKQPYSSKTDFLNSSLSLNYQLIRGLRLSTTLGYNNAQANQLSLVPIASQDPSTSPTGSAQFGDNNNKNWNLEPQLTYDAHLSKGKISILAGGALQETNTDGLSVTGSGYTNDALLRTISNAVEDFASDNYGEYRYAALFGRITYNWENEYILNFNARRDGSSRFGPGSQFGNFGSVGAAWIFTQENVIKDRFPFISFGKLRGSYGTTGSDAVGDYEYLTRWGSGEAGNPYDSIQALAPLQAANPNYHWQVNKKLEGSIDLGFLKDAINVNLVWYRNRCGNQLIAFPTPAFTGFTSVTANSPALVQNVGWEITANARLINTSDFIWTISFNTAINRNKLVAYPDLAESPYLGIYTIGKPLNMVYLLHYTGVDPQTGQYSFEDKNHDGEISYRSGHLNDDSYIYSLTPKFFGGVGMNFSYKTLQLSLFFNVKDQIGKNALATGLYPGKLQNQPTSILGHEWKNPGDIASEARFTTSPNRNDIYYADYSDGAYTDASFIRLSNLSLSYRLPDSFNKKVGVQGCSLFFHTNNLFVITRYKGVDPETQNFGGMPPVKLLVGGVSFNF
jgi:TonB-linked SusC/RagA family outer membrane protein